MIAQDLQRILGRKGWLSDPVDLHTFATDWIGRSNIMPIGIARPATTDEVSQTVRACAAAGVHIVPQGGRTGLVMGNLPHRENSIILSMSRMNRIAPINPDDFCVSLEAGVVLEQLHQNLDGTGLMFPLHLGAEGTAQIGGLIATNAGGNMAFRYGMMMDQILGLEVVLPDGRVWNGMRRLIKDNAGFHLRRLFCGSEGRLGIITAAILRLHNAPKSRATALFAARSMRDVMHVGTAFRYRLGELVTGLEFMNDTVLDIALSSIPDLVFPLDNRAGAYLLVELSSALPDFQLSELLEDVFAAEFERGAIVDGVIAQNESQRENLWKLREELPEGQRLFGPQVKHDISVPVSRVAEFIEASTADTHAIQPDVRICAFGHLGDGNIHYNYSLPAASSSGDFRPELSEAVYDRLTEMGGSFAAEHGLGFSKAPIADKRRSATERDLMRSLRGIFNPDDVLNPGVSVD